VATAVLTALVALAGSSFAGALAPGPADGEPDTVLRTAVEATDGSETVLWLRPLAGATEVRVEVKAQVRRGTFRFVLQDGRGEEVFDAAGGADTALVGDSGPLDCAGGRCAGDWRLVARARGDGRWTLRAWGVAVVSGPEQRPGQ
jgi:hypothetical protein